MRDCDAIVADRQLARRARRRETERLRARSRTSAYEYLEHVYAKLGVRSRGAAAMFAMRHGLITSGEVVE